MDAFSDGVEELQKILSLGRQQWLLGAGVSSSANIPLMYPLTTRVKACLGQHEAELLGEIMADMPATAHIEHALSQLGDLIAIADRSQSKTARIGDNSVSLANLKQSYECVIRAIATTVRYGYRAASGGNAEAIGTPEAPLVNIDDHRNFVRALFSARANLEERSRVGFITTNYDTLLEDALALDQRECVDGFVGGAVAFWNSQKFDGEQVLLNRTHKVLKLHGSVDWFSDPTAGLLRVRYGATYLADLSNTLIYPQATKYVETQKDPFAKLFDCFRKTLAEQSSHVLAIVGYSFGDNHINAEIENALRQRSNKTTVVAFSQELPDPVNAGQTKLCDTLETWRTDSVIGSRIYVASDKALYYAKGRAEPPAAPLAWWTFNGVSSFLKTGVAV